MDWKTIETAPRDGTPILIGSSTFVDKAKWSEEDQFWTDGFFTFSTIPTHWMHLPEPPK